MRTIFKILNYIPEENCIIIRFCKETSRKSIDEHKEVAVRLDDFDLHDSECFVDSVMRRMYHKIEKENLSEPILETNQGEELSGPLDLKELEGRTIRCGYHHSKNVLPLKMKEITL